jgi:hypothetical protein
MALYIWPSIQRRGRKGDLVAALISPKRLE